MAFMNIDAYRNNLIRRREGAGISVKGLTPTGGDISAEDCLKNGFWRVNCKQLVGIATTTEAGLTPARFPIRFILGNAPTTTTAAAMSSGYWAIANAVGNALFFSKRGLQTDIALKNLRVHVQNLDTALWDAYRDIGIRGGTPSAELLAKFDAIYDDLIVPNPTGDQAAAIQTKFDEIIALCREAKVYPRFKITATYYLWGRPIGGTITTVADGSTKYAYESMLNVSVNASRLEERTPGLDSGVYTLAAYAIAAMFRYGLFECYANAEYYTVFIAVDENDKNKVAVTGITCPAGADQPTGIKVGDEYDLSTVRLSRKMTELAPGLLVMAGINHYMLNHTTGGPIASGSLLTFLAMANMITSDMDKKAQEDVTTVFYEALHPVNKRAIADLFIKESQVLVHGKDSTAHRYEELDLDTFTRIRGRANPAGSHKAVICVSTLVRIVDAGLAPLLPWSSEINTCIESCKEVMTIGARAHVGSDYYTGLPAKTQSASLDRYMPDLAAYIHIMSKGDSLSFSPHLSATIAASSNATWVALLKDLRTKDIGMVSGDVVRRYLSSAGKAYYAFDPEDESTWGGALNVSQVAKMAIGTFL